MNIEQPQNPESNKQAVIDTLKQLGIENPEARELLVQWTRKREEEVEALGTREAQLDFEIERADLYLNAGFADAGREALEDALMIAEQENILTYVEKIVTKLKELQ